MDLSLCANARASVVGKLQITIRIFNVKFIENADVQDIQVYGQINGRTFCDANAWVVEKLMSTHSLEAKIDLIFGSFPQVHLSKILTTKLSGSLHKFFLMRVNLLTTVATQGADVTSFRCLRRFTGSQLSGLGDNSHGEHFLFAINNETQLEQGHVQIYDGVSWHLDLVTLNESDLGPQASAICFLYPRRRLLRAYFTETRR